MFPRPLRRLLTLAAACAASAAVHAETVNIAVAANFAADGQVGDWAGSNPPATDPAGDATSGESAIDIVEDRPVSERIGAHAAPPTGT